jgi:2-polyprenyl-3-methyl-5-hydroxy-6-metoxy-1,4-benzoquinol methylase/putative flippase GtrA
MIASAFSATITMGLPIVLHESMSVREEAAVAVGLATAFIVNFTILRGFVFESRGHRGREIVAFAATSAGFRALDYVTFLIGFRGLRLHYVVAMVLMLSASAIGKFVVYRWFVFSGRRSGRVTAAPVGIDAVARSEVESGNRTYHRAQEQMELLPNYYEWTYRDFRSYLHGLVVELGCGAGMGVATYIGQASRVYAVDYNDELMRRVARRFPSPKVVPIRVDLSGSWEALGDVAAHAVVMMDVLEHFADDQAVAEKAWKLLVPGGHLLVKVPAQRSMFSNMDRASGHFRRYDAADLRALMDAAGFDPVSVREINPIGALVYRLKNRTNTNFSRTFSPRQLWIINALLPFLRWFDVLPFGGLSLTGVFRKPPATAALATHQQHRIIEGPAPVRP